MSILAKRRELADLRAKTKALNDVIGDAYKKLKDAAVLSAQKDFRSFFTDNKFSVTSPTASGFSSDKKILLTAEYQGMKAFLSSHPDSSYFLNIQSNIVNTDTEYSFRIGVKNPKDVSPSFGRTSSPKDEEAKLDQEIEEAKKSVNNAEASKSGLPDSHATFLSLYKTTKGQKIAMDGESKDFIVLLKSIFD